MAGLQDSGKTTLTTKLAKFLKEQHQKIIVTSKDVYRSAAIKQLVYVVEPFDIDIYCLQKKNAFRNFYKCFDIS